MSRRPRYNKTQAFRIISLPAGMWQLQEHMGGKGTKTFDPWKKIGHPIDFGDDLDKGAATLLNAIDARIGA